MPTDGVGGRAAASRDGRRRDAGPAPRGPRPLLAALALAALLGPALAPAAAADREPARQSGGQTPSRPSNVSAIRLGPRETDNWLTFGNATIDVDSGSPKLRLTESLPGQLGAAFFNTPLSRANSLAGGFLATMVFWAESVLISAPVPSFGSQGMSFYLGPAITGRGDSAPFPHMYPPPGSRQMPGALEIMFSTSTNDARTEPSEEKVAVYVNRVVEWQSAVCKMTVPFGTFTFEPVQIIISLTPFNETGGPNSTTLAVTWFLSRVTAPREPNLVCRSPILDSLVRNWTASTSGPASESQLGLLSGTLASGTGNDVVPLSENAVLSLSMEYCRVDNGVYRPAGGGSSSACICLPGYIPDPSGESCIPRNPPAPGISAGAIAGIVVGSVALAGLVAGLGYWVGVSRRKDKDREDALTEGGSGSEGSTDSQALQEMDSASSFPPPSAPPMRTVTAVGGLALVEPTGPALEELEAASAEAELSMSMDDPSSLARSNVQPSAPPDHEALIRTTNRTMDFSPPSPVSPSAPAPPRTVSATAGAAADPPPPPYTEVDPHVMVGAGSAAPPAPRQPPAALPAVAPAAVAAVAAVAPVPLAGTVVIPSPNSLSGPTVVPPARTASIAPNGATTGRTDLPKPLHMVAIKNFVASRPDEIPLTVGDILAVRSLFDDGWAFGTDHSLDAAANNNGYFPIAAAKTLTGEAMASYLSNGPPTEPAAAEAMAASGPNPPTTAPAATAPAPTAPAETEPAVQQ